MSLCIDFEGKKITQNSIIEVKKNKKTKYFLVEGEPTYTDGLIYLPGKYLMKNFSYNYRLNDNHIIERSENIKLIGTKEKFIPDVEQIKFLYKKNFVKAFKDECKKNKTKQTDFIKESMLDFINKK